MGIKTKAQSSGRRTGAARRRPRLAITLGDPAGIGPEVIARALADRRVAAQADVLVLGDLRTLEQAAARVRARIKIQECADTDDLGKMPWDVIPLMNPFPLHRVVPGHWTQETGMASAAAVYRAVDLIQQGRADALVTGPICKAAWQAAGITSPGHTEMLAALTGSKKYAMMFSGGPFQLVLATIHEPLAKVPGLLTRRKIVMAAGLAIRELQQRFGIQRPKVAVAGLNPHAGEGGLFGNEEARLIVPAIRELKRQGGARIEGPFAPDTLFVEAARGLWDLVVCMYHDQGLIPFKMLALHSGVNITAGLPLIRTSPDHGTAFDLAGTGRANPGSMIAAILTAVKMVRNMRKER